MAFWQNSFLNDRRAELLRSVKRFQYQRNGGTWYDGEINSKEIVGTDVVVFVNVPSFGVADTITGVRVYDNNNALASNVFSLAIESVNKEKAVFVSSIII